jgi:hypothetical protein
MCVCVCVCVCVWCARHTHYITYLYIYVGIKLTFFIQYAPYKTKSQNFLYGVYVRLNCMSFPFRILSYVLHSLVTCVLIKVDVKIQ